MSKIGKRALLLAGLVLSHLDRTHADSLTLEWALAPAEDKVAGYFFHAVNTLGQISSLDIGLTNRYVTPDLGTDPHLFFVTAYNSLGLESEASQVLQYPPDGPCLLAASYDGSFIPATRTTSRFFVTTRPDCPWSATTDASWIQLGEPVEAGGQVIVPFVAHSNDGGDVRSALVSVAGRNFNVVQSGGGPFPPFLIKTLPGALTINQDAPLHLSIEAEEEIGKELRYQWLKDGVPITGANGPTWDLKAVQPDDAGRYVATVSNDIGTTQTDPLELSVYAKPRIAVEPINHVVNFGERAILFVTAFGPELHYQWTKDGVPLSVDSPVLIVYPVQPADLGVYQVSVLNLAGVLACDSVYLSTPQHERELGRIHIQLQSDQTLSVQGEGIPGATYDILISSDLIDWHYSDSVTADESGFFTIGAPPPTDGTWQHWYVRTLRRSLPASSTPASIPEPVGN
jgi:hypothetical protein